MHLNRTALYNFVSFLAFINTLLGKKHQLKAFVQIYTKSVSNRLFCRISVPLPEQHLATASVAVLLHKELKSSIKILLIGKAQ